MEDQEYQSRLRNGTLPIITTNIPEPKIRRCVNSEKFPWFPLDGFRVLHNNTVFERKKSWWIFGKWEVKYHKSKDMEICVLDEGWIR